MDLLGGAGDGPPDPTGGLIAGESQGATAAPGPGGAQRVGQERQSCAQAGTPALTQVPQQEIGQTRLQDQAACLRRAFDGRP